MNKLPLVFILCIYYHVSLLSQQTQADSLRTVLNADLTKIEKIKVHAQLFSSFVNSQSDSALVHARMAYQLSDPNEEPKLYGQSIMDLGHAYFVNNHLDSIKQLLIGAIPFYNEQKEYFWLSSVYRNLAVIGEVEEQPDSSLYYLDECLAVLAEHPDSLVLGDVYLSKGFAYRTKGYYELSIEALLNASRIFEHIDNENRKGYVSQNLGLTYYQSGRLEEGIKSNNQSIKHFIKANNLRAAGQSLNNVGVYHYKLKEYNPAKKAHLTSIEYAKQTEQFDVLLDNYLNICDIYFDENQLDSFNIWLAKANALADSLDYKQAISDVDRYQARLAIIQKNGNAAHRFTSNATKNINEYFDPQYQKAAYTDLSEILESLEQYDEAMFYLKQANAIEDSLFTLKRDQQVEELNLIYQTERKDAEIILLNKNAELDSTRKNALWGGLALSSLLFLSVIFSIQQKRKREKFIFEQEKELETERRKNLEMELEFKKKELIAKALQLAGKNEFLHKLEDEIQSLQSTVDHTVKTTSEKISRMIRYDSSDDDEWNQFSKEFSSIHSDFTERLLKTFGKFSTSEMRLITLLKMNLSSKDIANILRISEAGIKKARYRLRKKMNLESDMNLQSYIMAF